MVALIDWGASSNYVSMHLCKEMGLKMTKTAHSIKVVNHPEEYCVSRVEQVSLQVGLWLGITCLFSIPCDQFDMILGQSFAMIACVISAPHLGKLIIQDPMFPCEVPFCEPKTHRTQFLSAIQLKKACWKKSKTLWLASLIGAWDEPIGTYLEKGTVVDSVLKQFTDVMLTIRLSWFRVLNQLRLDLIDCRQAK